MRLISTATATNMEKGSWIRQMFEAGINLKKEYGEQAVFDFSLGNPDLPPPSSIAKALRDLADRADKPLSMGYMPNAGFPWAREALAKHLSAEQQITLGMQDVILTCGASGALNCLFKTILDPGDEVIALAPYFVEYGSYVANHNGVFRIAETKTDTFEIDINAIEAAITPRTRAIMINSPNNPTGQVYSEAELKQLTALLTAKNAQADRPIFLIADEPYRFLAFDGVTVPPVLPMYPYAVIASSFSKNLSIPGERIGYLAVSPLLEGREQLMNGLIMANRVLGYVNPPVAGQYLMVNSLDTQVDASIYERRKNAMASVLRDAGYDFLMPKGAFYFFPKAPGGDDVAFTAELMKQKILAVPGRGFGRAGYFRLTFCVDENIILRAADGFKKALCK